MGLTFVATLEPMGWDRDERMIAMKTLDIANKAAGRPDWLAMKQSFDEDPSGQCHEHC